MTPRILVLEVGILLSLGLLGLSVYGLFFAAPGALSTEPPFLWAGLVLGAINCAASVRGLRLAHRERREARLYADLGRAWRA